MAIQHKEEAPKQTAKTLIEVAILQYKPQLEKGDYQIIADESGESLRTVRYYMQGSISRTETGSKIVSAMRKVILDREKKVIKSING